MFALVVARLLQQCFGNNEIADRSKHKATRNQSDRVTCAIFTISLKKLFVAFMFVTCHLSTPVGLGEEEEKKRRSTRRKRKKKEGP